MHNNKQDFVDNYEESKFNSKNIFKVLSIITYVLSVLVFVSFLGNLIGTNLQILKLLSTFLSFLLPFTYTIKPLLMFVYLLIFGYLFLTISKISNND